MEIRVRDRLFRRSISRQEIAQRVTEIGMQITADYAGRNPLFLCVLKGSFMFAADLSRAATLPSELCFIKISSYEGLQSTGNIRMGAELPAELSGRHVIVVEDIIDTGKTLHVLLEKIKELGPASLKTAALLVKPEMLRYPVRADYTGFSIPDRFVIGYGLDYDEAGRALPDIYEAVEEG